MCCCCVGSTHDFSHFELGRPTVRGNLFAVATDTPEASQHFLAVMSAKTVLSDIRDDPLVCYTRIDEHVSDLHWLTGDRLLGATGKGNLKLFSFDGETVEHTCQSLNHQCAPTATALCASRLHLLTGFFISFFFFSSVSTGDMKDVCKSYIREIAVQPQTVNKVVLGGFDQKLNFLDLNRPDVLFTQRLDMQGIIGSVKWAPFHGGAYASTALDDGKFYLFDARLKIKEASFFFDSRKEDMYTHERYNEFGVLLGYGDGEFKHIDMRKANKVSVAQTRWHAAR